VFFIAFKPSSLFFYHCSLLIRLYPSVTIIQVEVGLRQKKEEESKRKESKET